MVFIILIMNLAQHNGKRIIDLTCCLCHNWHAPNQYPQTYKHTRAEKTKNQKRILVHIRIGVLSQRICQSTSIQYF